MNRLVFHRRLTHCLLSVPVLFLVGCGGHPSGVAPPRLDPAGSAARALAEYDKNGDQKLSKDELQACPGLLASFARFDIDGDGAISATELETKLRDIEKEGAGLVVISCEVRRGGQPLEGATVTLVPESFLADTIKPASGITSQKGSAAVSIAEEELPSEYRGRLSGVNCGVYRVVVTHPSFQVPAKFNTQTKIGRLVTRRDNEPLKIDL